MREECYENLMSKNVPDETLVPAHAHCVPESTWKTHKDNMDGNMFHALVHWNRTSAKPPKSANETTCDCMKGECVDRSTRLNRNCYAECEDIFVLERRVMITEQ